MSRLVQSSVLLLAMVLASGCGPTAARITPVEGVVKLNGKPAANLLVQFHHMTADGKTVSASGVSDASGKFVLKSGDREGAAEGNNKVTLVDNNLATEDEPGPGMKKLPPNRISQEYMSVSTTPLEVIVEAGKKEYEINIPARR